MTSQRVRHLLGGLSPLVEAHFRCAADPWHATDNPGGYVHLGTAENRLLWDLLGPALEAAALQEGDSHYVELHGTDACRAAVARLHGDMDPDKMAVTSGTSAALDILATALFEPGDGILIPAPYYSGFEVCFGARAGVRVIPVPMHSDDGFRLDVEGLEAALVGAEAEAVTVRGLLLCHPHNPLGAVAGAERIDAWIAWARNHGLHIISDEIYRHSIHDSDAASSYRSLLTTHAGPDLHVVYGLAKDVGLSGFKVGAVHSDEPDVVAACQQLAYLSPVSSQTQSTVVRVLERTGDQLIAENPSRLRAAYLHLADLLDEAEIAHHPASAGLFAMLDLRDALAAPSWEAEAALYERLLAARVNISPASAFHGPEPGWFRLCFADEPAKVAEGVRRIAGVLHGEQGGESISGVGLGA